MTSVEFFMMMSNVAIDMEELDCEDEMFDRLELSFPALATQYGVKLVYDGESGMVKISD